MISALAGIFSDDNVKKDESQDPTKLHEVVKSDDGKFKRYVKYNKEQDKRVDVIEWQGPDGEKHCGFVTYDVSEVVKDGKTVEELTKTSESRSIDFDSAEDCADKGFKYMNGGFKGRDGYTSSQLKELDSEFTEDIPDDIVHEIDSIYKGLSDNDPKSRKKRKSKDTDDSDDSEDSDESVDDGESDADGSEDEAQDGATLCKGVVVESDGSERQCENRTNNENGYCEWHQDQAKSAAAIERDMVAMAMSCIDDRGLVGMSRSADSVAPRMRCAYVSPDGARCARMASVGSNYCWQHESARISSYATAPRVPDSSGFDGARSGACPLCGDPNFDGEFCDICGFEEFAEGFGDIEIEDVDVDDVELDDDMYDFEPSGIDVEHELDMKIDELIDAAEEDEDEGEDEDEDEYDGDVDDDEMFFA